MKLLVALVDPMVSYRDSSEGLVDLLGGEAFLLEERPPVDDGGALDLGVGEELDGVLDVVLPHGLRRRLEHELLCPGSRVSIRCSCYGRDPVQSAVIRNSGSQSLVGLGIQYNRTVRGGRIMELEGGRYLGLGIAAGRSRWWRPWPRPRLSRDRAGVVGNGTARHGTGEASSFPCAVVLQCATSVVRLQNGNVFFLVMPVWGVANISFRNIIFPFTTIFLHAKNIVSFRNDFFPCM